MRRTAFLDLTDDVLDVLIGLLDCGQLLRLRGVCRALKARVEKLSLLEPLAARAFGSPEPFRAILAAAGRDSFVFAARVLCQAGALWRMMRGLAWAVAPNQSVFQTPDEGYTNRGVFGGVDGGVTFLHWYAKQDAPDYASYPCPDVSDAPPTRYAPDAFAAPQYLASALSLSVPFGNDSAVLLTAQPGEAPLQLTFVDAAHVDRPVARETVGDVSFNRDGLVCLSESGSYHVMRWNAADDAFTEWFSTPMTDMSGRYYGRPQISLIPGRPDLVVLRSVSEIQIVDVSQPAAPRLTYVAQGFGGFVPTVVASDTHVVYAVVRALAVVTLATMTKADVFSINPQPRLIALGGPMFLCGLNEGMFVLDAAAHELIALDAPEFNQSFELLNMSVGNEYRSTVCSLNGPSLLALMPIHGFRCPSTAVVMLGPDGVLARERVDMDCLFDVLSAANQAHATFSSACIASSANTRILMVYTTDPTPTLDVNTDASAVIRVAALSMWGARLQQLPCLTTLEQPGPMTFDASISIERLQTMDISGTVCFVRQATDQRGFGFVDCSLAEIDEVVSAATGRQ